VSHNSVVRRLSTQVAGLGAMLLALCAPCGASAQSTNSLAASPGDYSNPKLWLCRPGRTDACTANLDATIVADDGTMTQEAFHADPDAPIDCFYVYPTVSKEPTGNADFAIDADVTRAAVQQFARFSARCRLFAPVYRQITIPGLVSFFSGKPLPMSRQLAYDDVKAAWQNYLANDNQGRGFVLVGHSQGTGILSRLIREEIDGKPIQAQMVSALLIGGALGEVSTQRDASIPLVFPHITACRTSAEVGCVVGYSSFRAEAPPAADTLFEKAPEGKRPVCANPAALEGGAGALDAYLSTSGATLVGEAKSPVNWTDPPHPIDTPFVKVPGLLSASCVDDGKVVYLAISRATAKDSHRASDITGDLRDPSGKIMPSWGLHLIDVNLAMGNLLGVVADETRAYLAKATKP